MILFLCSPGGPVRQRRGHRGRRLRVPVQLAAVLRARPGVAGAVQAPDCESGSGIWTVSTWPPDWLPPSSGGQRGVRVDRSAVGVEQAQLGHDPLGGLARAGGTRTAWPCGRSSGPRCRRRRPAPRPRRGWRRCTRSPPMTKVTGSPGAQLARGGGTAGCGSRGDRRRPRCRAGRAGPCRASARGRGRWSTRAMPSCSAASRPRRGMAMVPITTSGSARSGRAAPSGMGSGGRVSAVTCRCPARVVRRCGGRHGSGVGDRSAPSRGPPRRRRPRPRRPGRGTPAGCAGARPRVRIARSASNRASLR